MALTHSNNLIFIRLFDMLTTAKVLTLYGRLLYFSHLKNLLQINIDFNEIFYVVSTLNRVFGTQ